MSRIDSLNMLSADSGKLALQEKYGPVLENLSKETLRGRLMNKDLSGDPTAGSIEAKRFVNAKSAAYGTARTAGKGTAVKGKAVTVSIDQDKEIIEEVEEKDTRMSGVDNLINRRVKNHGIAMDIDLETDFFAKAEAGATDVDVASITDVAEKLEKVILTICTTKNDFVNGIDRSMVTLTLSSAAYSKVRNLLDKNPNSNINSAEGNIQRFHGVRVEENFRQTAAVLAQIEGCVAQPCHPTLAPAGKLPLSNAYGFGVFYSFGTKVVMPDLLYKLATL